MHGRVAGRTPGFGSGGSYQPHAPATSRKIVAWFTNSWCEHFVANSPLRLRTSRPAWRHTRRMPPRRAISSGRQNMQDPFFVGGDREISIHLISAIENTWTPWCCIRSTVHSYRLISWTYSSQPWQLQELRWGRCVGHPHYRPSDSLIC